MKKENNVRRNKKKVSIWVIMPVVMVVLLFMRQCKLNCVRERGILLSGEKGYNRYKKETRNKTPKGGDK